MPERTIAWVIGGFEGYGVERMIRSLGSEIRSRGWRTDVISISPGRLVDRCASDGFGVTDLGLPLSNALQGGLLKKAVQFAGMLQDQREIAKRLRATLRNRDVDVLHILRATTLGAVGKTGNQLGIPVVWELARQVSDRLPMGLNRRFFQHTCRKYNIVPIGISHYVAESLSGSDDFAEVIPLGADATLFDPEKVAPVSRESLGIARDAVVLGTMARLVEDKGHLHLVESIGALGESGADVHLLLVGGPMDSPFVEHLRDRVDRLGLSDRVTLAGATEEPERYFGTMDVLVNFRISPEAFGLSVVEAMLMRKPVLVHALGGPAETVIDGQTGWHVQKPDVASLTEGVRRLLADRARLSSMGEAARERALACYTLSRQGEEYERLILRLTGSQ